MGKEYNLRGNTVVADHFRSLDGDVLDAQGVEDAIKNKTEVAALVALTDNSGGAADNTVAAIPTAGAVTITLSTTNTYTDAAVKAAVDTGLASITTNINTLGTAVKNDVADLAAKVNALIAALKA